MKKLLIKLCTALLAVACGNANNVNLNSESVTTKLPQPDNLEAVSVAQVIDGDTINLTDGRRVRYIGINTPERNTPYYQEATQLNKQLLQQGQIQLEYDVEQTDQYGRTLAYIWVDNVLVNQQLVAQGYANVLFIAPNGRYEAEFRQAEQVAQQTGIGIWQQSAAQLKITRIQANAPGKDNENPNGEWIEITNQGNQPVAMQNFTLKDEGNHNYTFGNVTLNPHDTVRLYSGQGQDSSTELYWGKVDDSVWNNRGDAAFLRDNNGALVDEYRYTD